MLERGERDMPDDFIDTYFFAGRWWNRVVGGGMEAVSEHDSLDEAVAAGRALAEARESEHFIRDADCQLVGHRSYRQPGGLVGHLWSRAFAS